MASWTRDGRGHTGPGVESQTQGKDPHWVSTITWSGMRLFWHLFHFKWVLLIIWNTRKSALSWNSSCAHFSLIHAPHHSFWCLLPFILVYGIHGITVWTHLSFFSPPPHIFGTKPSYYLSDDAGISFSGQSMPVVIICGGWLISDGLLKSWLMNSLRPPCSLCPSTKENDGLFNPPPSQS